MTLTRSDSSLLIPTTRWMWVDKMDDLDRKYLVSGLRVTLQPGLDTEW